VGKGGEGTGGGRKVEQTAVAGTGLSLGVWFIRRLRTDGSTLTKRRPVGAGAPFNTEPGLSMRVKEVKQRSGDLLHNHGKKEGASYERGSRKLKHKPKFQRAKVE